LAQECCTLCRSLRNSATATSPRLLMSVMRLPSLVLAYIVTAHRRDLYLEATTGEGSDTSSIAATTLQNFTAFVGTHGSGHGVLSRAGLGLPRKLMQRLALILAASTVLGGPLRTVEAKAMPTAMVTPGIRRNALGGSGFRINVMEAAGPGSGIPDPSGSGGFMDEVKKGTTADVKKYLKGLDEVAKASAAAVAIASTIGVSPALAGDITAGQKVFDANCAGCHLAGKNVILPATQKTLEKDALDKYLAGGRNEAAVITISTNGKNAMPGYGTRLSEDDIQNVASYVIATSEKGWDKE